MRALIMFMLACCGQGTVEIYRAWPSTGGPSYSWPGTAADWQRTWQNNSDMYQRKFPIFETADELHIQSSKYAYAGTSDLDAYRTNAVLGLRPFDLLQNCSASACENALRLQNVLSKIGNFTIHMDIQQYTQNGMQDYALGQRSFFLVGMEKDPIQNGVNAAGIGFAVGIRTAFYDQSYESDRISVQAFRTDNNSVCYRKDCNVFYACGIPCEVRIMNASYVPLTPGTLETPWLNVTYDFNAETSMLSLSVWNGSEFIVPYQVAFLPNGIKNGTDLAIGIGVYLGSIRIRNFIITTNAIAEPPTPSPTIMPTQFPTLSPTPLPTSAPTPSPTPAPTTNPTTTTTESTLQPTPLLTLDASKTSKSFEPNKAPTTNAENGSSGFIVYLYAVPVALLLAALACFSWQRARKHERMATQYTLSDMTVEPLPPSRLPPMVVPSHASQYASTLSVAQPGYVAPAPQQPNYAELSISSGTGYEPTTVADFPAYGITSLAVETSRSRRNSRQR